MGAHHGQLYSFCVVSPPALVWYVNIHIERRFSRRLLDLVLIQPGQWRFLRSEGVEEVRRWSTQSKRWRHVTWMSRCLCLLERFFFPNASRFFLQLHQLSSPSSQDLFIQTCFIGSFSSLRIPSPFSVPALSDFSRSVTPGSQFPRGFSAQHLSVFVISARSR